MLCIQLLHYVISAYKPESLWVFVATQWYVPFTFYLLYILFSRLWVWLILFIYFYHSSFLYALYAFLLKNQWHKYFCQPAVLVHFEPQIFQNGTSVYGGVCNPKHLPD